MSIGRNDPCPCGSGRKYKHCCLKNQPVEPGPNGSAQHHEAQFLTGEVREAAAAADSWQAEAVPILVSFDDEKSVRPVAVLLTAAGFAVHTRVLPRLGGEPADVASALERAVVTVARELGSLPAEVVVRHHEVGDALTPLLAPRDVAVRVEDPLPDLEDLARAAMMKMADNEVWPPVGRATTWGCWRLPRALVAELFAAAAAFWRAAPWRTMQNEQAPAFTAPSGRDWTVLVLGHGGEEFGLSLYSRRDDVERSFELGSEDSPFPRIAGRIIALSFDDDQDVDPAARREARDARWETAGAIAFPTLMTINTPGGGVSRRDAEDLIAALRAMPDFEERHRKALVREHTAEQPGPRVEYVHEATGSRIDWDPADDAELGWIESEPVDGLPNALRSELSAIIAEAAAELGEDADPDAILAAARARIEQTSLSYNRAPQADLGGMSPEAVHHLLDADWLDPDSAMHVRPGLDPDDLARTTMQRHTLIILRMAIEQDGLPATEKGNLRVAVVRELIDRMELHDSVYVPSDAKRIIETDVRPIWLLRTVLEMAGLLHRRKGRFHATLLARRLVEPPHQTDLYARVLSTWFQKLDIAATAEFDRWPELQHQFAFSIRRFAEVGDEWRTSAELLDAIVLPFALMRAPRLDYMNLPASLLQSRLFEHLESFGLAEKTPVEGEWFGHPDTTWRRSDRLLRVFEWEEN